MSTLLREPSKQDLAANPGTSAWVGASAGTGKTYMLTNRVLRLLLADARPQGILCLTFTKAAAAEMANRVNSRLAEWATADDDVLYKALATLEEGIPPNAVRIAKARRLFAEVLDVPGGLKIETIHAFCQSLMSRFPLETGIAPHFQVMDDRSAAELMMDAVARVLARAHAGRDPDLTEALDFVSAHLTDFQFTGLLRELTARPAAFAGNDDSRLYRLLGLEPGTTERDIIAAACRDGVFEHAGLQRICAAMTGGSTTDQTRGAGIADWLAASESDRAGRFAEYAALFLTASAPAKIRERLVTAKITKTHPDATDVLASEGARLLDVATRIKAVRAATASSALAVLGRALSRTYAALKEQRAVLDYDDLIAKARALVTGSTAWVLYKLDEGLDHILVDEAQDTNPDQWAVIDALAAEFFTGQGARDGERTIFAVGDAKQSIYSFQRAEPAEFERMRRTFRRRADLVDKRFLDASLEISFRSTEAVLALVDAVFQNDVARNGLVFGEPGDPGRIERIEHKAYRKGVAGEVELWPVERPPEVEAPGNWEPPVRRRPIEPAETRLARRIARQIRHWLDTGAPLESAGRPIRPDDVMVLVRRRNSFFTAMVRELKAAQVPVAGVDRMVLTEQLAVMDLLALGRFVLMPEDDLTLAVVLKSPLVGLSEDDLFRLAYQREGRLWPALTARREEPAFAPAWAFLGHCLARADFVPPYEFYAEVLDTGRRRAMLKRLGLDALDPMDEFLALALDYERNHAPSLQGFIHWIEAAETEVKRELEQGNGQVRVMTVHGAKGLQAPIVFLPDTCTIPQDARSLYWLEEDTGAPVLAWPVRAENVVGAIAEARDAGKRKRDEEYNRQLYVALTRAGDRLYVCGYETARGRPANCWYDLTAEAFDRLGAAEAKDFAGNPVRRLRMGGEVVEQEVTLPTPAGPAPAPLWLAAPPPEEPAPVRPLAPSRPTLPEMPVRSPMEAGDRERFLRGTLMHRLLQWLPDVAPAERPGAARRFLGQPGHGLSSAVVAAWTEEVLRILDDPACAALFGPGSAAEVPVTGLLGTRAISGQIDRLAVTEDAVMIVDYKTNRPPPLCAEDVPPLYLGQMAAYRDLLRRIYPGRPVRCALLWTDGPSLMTLPDALLDPHAPAP
ncbi:double-strand break repair helicase AddA [Iodidimonas sp. SYSU 1G8]|uniref:double-strand break repair helicase AddA n=1 Tax=Iodidimonas sp. SYSU 1G8 TaxID=3133967 RepID=UPI0031FF0297